MKKSVILFACLSLMAVSACNNTNQENQQQKNETSTDNDGQTDGNTPADASSESGDNNQSADDTNSDDGTKGDDAQTDVGQLNSCQGAAAYKDLPFFGKVAVGYPCNVDGDCAGTDSYCDANYSCTEKDSDNVIVTIANLGDFHPCFSDDQCASGHCETYEEDLGLCAAACQAGAQSDGNFSCENGFCLRIVPEPSEKSCTNRVYDCGYDGDCNDEGQCEI